MSDTKNRETPVSSEMVDIENVVYREEECLIFRMFICVNGKLRCHRKWSVLTM